MKYVPRREKNRRAFNSPEGLELLEKVTYAAKKYNDTKTLWRESLTPEETGPLRESTPSVTVNSPKEKDEKNGN